MVGGTTGALGGPVLAGAGAGAGWALGELARGDAELEEAKQTIQALTTGDVNALLEIKLKEKKDSGFFDSILDGIYNILQIIVVVIAIWMIVQLWFSRHIHTKITRNANETRAPFPIKPPSK